MVGRIDGVTLELMGEDVSTLCGKVAAATDEDVHSYTLTDSNGNLLRATTIRFKVTCKKCSNLLTIGVLHANTPRKARSAQW
jgi:hypothetical protein